MSRVKQIIDSMPADMAKEVMKLRAAHFCLMELDGARIMKLQKMAVYLNFQAGDGKMYSSSPYTYERPDGMGGVITEKTHFRYIDKVR